LFSLIVPFWLIWAMCGWRSMLEVWPACLVAGGSFAVVQFAVSNYLGPTLVDIAASAISIVSLLTLLRVGKPRTSWEFTDSDDMKPVAPRREGERFSAVEEENRSPSGRGETGASGAAAILDAPTHTSPRRGTLVAWIPWLILSLLVFAWGLPPVKARLDALSAPTITVPMLHQQVFRAPPVVSNLKAEDARFLFNWLSATGTALLLSGIISGFLLGLHPVQLAR